MTPTGAQYASAGALLTRALGAVILRNDNTAYTNLNAAQKMLNAGCAALLGDAAQCAALLRHDGFTRRFRLEYRSIGQRGHSWRKRTEISIPGLTSEVMCAMITFPPNTPA